MTIALVPLIQNQFVVKINPDAIIGAGIEAVDAFIKRNSTAPTDRKVAARKTCDGSIVTPVKIDDLIIAGKNWLTLQGFVRPILTFPIWKR